MVNHDNAAAPVRYDATQAKRHFGEVLRRVGREEVIAVSRRGHDVAYVVPAEMFDRMRAWEAADADVLARLDADFDALVARMQTPAGRRAVDRLLEADDDSLNAIASGAATAS